MVRGEFEPPLPKGLRIFIPIRLSPHRQRRLRGLDYTARTHLPRSVLVWSPKAPDSFTAANGPLIVEVTNIFHFVLELSVGR